MPKRTGGRRQGPTVEAASGAPGAARRREAWLLAAILLLTIAVYARSLGNGFIYFDDPDAVVQNPYIRQIDLASALHWLSTPVQFMYMPLALLSYAIDYQLGGLDPAVYHRTNLLLHLGCVVLVFWVSRLLTGRGRLALVVALLFAVHPVNVDTVASVAARTNLLATLFSLGALGGYGLYLQRGQRARYLALSWLSFLLAACAKSSAVVLPLALLLWDHLHGRRRSARLLLEKIPFLAVSLALGAVALAMRTDAPPPVHYGPLDRALVFVYALAHYCVRLAVPWDLSMSYDYPIPTSGWLPLPFYLAPLLLAGIGWGIHALRVPRPMLVFGLSFFVLQVAPSQSVLLIDGFMANRYAYLPYLGLLLVLGEVVDRAAGARSAGAPSRAWLRAAAGAALAALVGGFSLLTLRRTAVWHDSMSLLDDVLQKQPGTPWVWGTRGLVELHAGDLAGARRDLDEALRLDPEYTPGLCYRGVVRFRLGEHRAALADLDRALARDPRLSGAHRDRGKVKLALQDEEGALEDFDRAIALDPRSEARFWRGMLKGDRGDYPGAVADFDVAIDNAPGEGDAFFMRGMARLGLGDHAAACADVAHARRLGYQPPAGQPVPVCP